MSSKRYPEEFKVEAVRQVTDRGHSVAEVASRLSVTTHSLYAWLKKYGPNAAVNSAKADEQAEIRRLKQELKRVTEERDILKKPRHTSRASPNEICLHTGSLQPMANPVALPPAGSASQRVLCVAR